MRPAVRSLNGRPLIPLVPAPPHPACEASVIIPAKDEAAGIGAALTALATQTDLDRQPLDPICYEIIVLANNCQDDTATLARAFAETHPTLRLYVVEITLPPDVACVGKARQLLMDEAYRRLSLAATPRPVILSTDADTVVAPDWIAANLAEIRRGVDAVGGRIVTDPASRAALEPQARYCYLSDIGYHMLMAELEGLLYPVAHDPLPRHFQHFGASLAITADAYAEIGGLPTVRALEDVAFAAELARYGKKIRHSPNVRVSTSARRSGRAERGLSEMLSAWAALGETDEVFLVDSATKIEARYHLRARLRTLHARLWSGERVFEAEIDAIADALCLPHAFVSAELRTPQSFESLRAILEDKQEGTAAWHERWSPVPFSRAIFDLRVRVAELRRNSTSFRPMERLLYPLEEIEAVAVSVAIVQQPQPIAAALDEEVVNPIASERVIVDNGCPVYQKEVATRL